MTTEIVTVKKPVSMWKLRLMGALAAGSGLVAVASAGAINTSVGPILDSLPPLFTSLVSLIVAAVPINVCRSVLAVGQNGNPCDRGFHPWIVCGNPW